MHLTGKVRGASRRITRERRSPLTREVGDVHAHSASGLLALLVDEPTDYGEDGHKDDKR